MSHNIKFSCISSTSICFLSNQHSVCSTHCSVISKIRYFISFPYILYSNDCIQLNIFIICNSVSSKCIFIIIIRFLEICKCINRSGIRSFSCLPLNFIAVYIDIQKFGTCCAINLNIAFFIPEFKFVTLSVIIECL